MPHHVVKPGGSARFEVPQAWGVNAEGFSRWACLGSDEGSVHMGFGVCELDAGGQIDSHLHSFEESFYVTDGSVVIDTPEGSTELSAGDYGIVPVGVPHRWRNPGSVPARWADMLAPQPQPGARGDTFAVAMPEGMAPVAVDPRDPRTRSFGHIEAANMEPGKQSQEMLAVSASMRTALLVYSGISVKMMVDSDLGAHLQTMFMVQYEPRGLAGAHDHPFEEAYFIIEGEVDAVLDGERYHLVPGDFAWAGVGSVHEFSNATSEPVRWLETQAPQPPSRHSYRFARDWDYLRKTLG